MWRLSLSFLGLSVAANVINDVSKKSDNDDVWWKSCIIYQIYPRSFKDSDGDGIGDLNGITEKLEHIKDLGADALWFSPIYSSPQKDFGYDISNYRDINEQYGTLDDFDNLIDKAKKLGIKVLMDFVPNHTSDEHEWFKKSVKRLPPYDDYYVWRYGKIDANGKRIPPNNWLSDFGKSAWEWNEEREQYYYHAFAIGQPDLNYRNAELRREMLDVLTFWMKRGVDGFRVDVVNHLFEAEELTDEPKSGRPNVPETDPDYLIHSYTRDLQDDYKVARSWRKLLDNYAKEHGTDAKLMITEAYASFEKTIKYYVDAQVVPFNFMFLVGLNNNSKPIEFKRKIDDWLNAVDDYDSLDDKDLKTVANWVIGNHDNHRVASRYGKKREDQMNLLSLILPGISVVYNGDEIGMVDRFFTYEETVDPPGVIAGPERYQLKSRDPQRTPYQWDDTISSGFSTSNKTWLPVNDNYKILNLKAEKSTNDSSHYKVFQTVAKLKRTNPVLREGRTEVLLATEDVLAVVRRLSGHKSFALLINFSNKDINIDAKGWLNIPEVVEIYVASVESGLTAGTCVNSNNFTIPGAASVLLH